MLVELTNFYNLLWEEEALRRFFLRHRDEVLTRQEINIAGMKQSFYRQRIVLSNHVDQKVKNKKVARRFKGKSTILELYLGQAIDEDLPASLEKTFSKVFSPMLKFIMNLWIPNKITRMRLLKELTESILSEKRLIQLLKKHGFIGEEKQLEGLEDLLGYGLNTINTNFPDLVSSEALSRVMEGIDQVAEYYSNWSFSELLKANIHYTNTLYDTENFKDRLELFDDLFDAGCITGGRGKAHYECLQCPPGTFHGSITLNVSPTKLHIPCPSCGREMLYMVPYQIQEDIFEDIIDDDGTLIFAIEHLLEEKEMKFQMNYHPEHDQVKDLESDIVLINSQERISGVIETKMLKSNRPFENAVSNVKRNLNKFLKAREKYILIDPNFERVPFHFVLNQYEPELFEKVKIDMAEELKNRPIFLYNPDEFRTYIQNV